MPGETVTLFRDRLHVDGRVLDLGRPVVQRVLVLDGHESGGSQVTRGPVGVHQLPRLDVRDAHIAHLSFRGPGVVLDLGEQLGLDPDAPARRVLGVGLRFSD